MKSSGSDSKMMMAITFNNLLVLLDSNMEMRKMLFLEQLKNHKFLQIQVSLHLVKWEGTVDDSL